MIQTCASAYSVFFEPQTESVLNCLLGDVSCNSLRVLAPPSWDEFSGYSRTQLESDLPEFVNVWIKYELCIWLKAKGWTINVEDYLVALRWVHRGLTPRLAVAKAYECRKTQEKFRERYNRTKAFLQEMPNV